MRSTAAVWRCASTLLKFHPVMSPPHRSAPHQIVSDPRPPQTSETGRTAVATHYLKAHSHRASTPTLGVHTPILFPMFDTGMCDADGNAEDGKNRNLLDFILGNVAVTLTLTCGVNGPLPTAVCCRCAWTGCPWSAPWRASRRRRTSGRAGSWARCSASVEASCSPPPTT